MKGKVLDVKLDAKGLIHPAHVQTKIRILERPVMKFCLLLGAAVKPHDLSSYFCISLTQHFLYWSFFNGALRSLIED